MRSERMVLFCSFSINATLCSVVCWGSVYCEMLIDLFYSAHFCPNQIVMLNSGRVWRK